ncbi:MAG: hypothetical protein LC745_00815, partial [Planctomycetia bacterium]|nr:hypothetical protein [Planctomycetia bacterium]
NPIRRHHLIVVNDVQSLGPSWARFLREGVSHWQVVRPPRFPSGLVLPTSQGRLVDTPFVDYLFWRRSLDPTRFDVYHPNVGPELGQFALRPSAHPRATSTVVSHRPLHPAAQNLPEPGTLAIAIVLVASRLAWRGRAEKGPLGP